MLTDEQIRAQLSEWIFCDFEIIDRGELEMMSAPDGGIVEARDEYLRKYRARLAALREIDPDGSKAGPKLLREHEKTIQILESLEPGEPLTFWEVRTADHLYSGVTSRLGMVSFYGPHPSD